MSTSDTGEVRTATTPETGFDRALEGAGRLRFPRRGGKKHLSAERVRILSDNP